MVINCFFVDEVVVLIMNIDVMKYFIKFIVFVLNVLVIDLVSNSDVVVFKFVVDVGQKVSELGKVRLVVMMGSLMMISLLIVLE